MMPSGHAGEFVEAGPPFGIEFGQVIVDGDDALPYGIRPIAAVGFGLYGNFLSRS
jgi:hypothetical protein